MKTERKYLNNFEMSILEKYGIKKLKKRYDVSDLLDMLPKRWKEGNKETNDEAWSSIQIWFNPSSMEWNCTTPYWFFEGACVKSTWNNVTGDTLLECLLNAVLTLIKRGFKEYIKKIYIK